MEDLTGRLQSLLSDPESVQNLAELAAMLGSGAAGETGSTADQPENAAAPAPSFDPAKLLAIGQAMSALKDDENTAFLLALRPHLSQERQARVTKAVRMLQILRIAAVLRENGLLGELLGGS